MDCESNKTTRMLDKAYRFAMDGCSVLVMIRDMSFAYYCLGIIEKMDNIECFEKFITGNSPSIKFQKGSISFLSDERMKSIWLLGRKNTKVLYDHHYLDIK